MKIVKERRPIKVKRFYDKQHVFLKILKGVVKEPLFTRQAFCKIKIMKADETSSLFRKSMKNAEFLQIIKKIYILADFRSAQE